MKRSTSLFAGAFLIGGLAAGLSFAGQAMASEYSQTASERIIEANLAARQPQIPGVHVSKPVEEKTLDAMVEQPDQQVASAADSQSAGGNAAADSNNAVVDVTVRNPKVPFDSSRTFQGWWKD